MLSHGVKRISSHRQSESERWQYTIAAIPYQMARGVRITAKMMFNYVPGGICIDHCSSQWKFDRAIHSSVPPETVHFVGILIVRSIGKDRWMHQQLLLESSEEYPASQRNICHYERKMRKMRQHPYFPEVTPIVTAHKGQSKIWLHTVILLCNSRILQLKQCSIIMNINVNIF